jgi:hypothetical protein
MTTASTANDGEALVDVSTSRSVFLVGDRNVWLVRARAKRPWNHGLSRLR